MTFWLIGEQLLQGREFGVILLKVEKKASLASGKFGLGETEQQSVDGIILTVPVWVAPIFAHGQLLLVEQVVELIDVVLRHDPIVIYGIYIVAHIGEILVIDQVGDQNQQKGDSQHHGELRTALFGSSRYDLGFKQIDIFLTKTFGAHSAIC